MKYLGPMSELHHYFIAVWLCWSTLRIRHSLNTF